MVKVKMKHYKIFLALLVLTLFAISTIVSFAAINTSNPITINPAVSNTLNFSVKGTATAGDVVYGAVYNSTNNMLTSFSKTPVKASTSGAFALTFSSSKDFTSTSLPSAFYKVYVGTGSMASAVSSGVYEFVYFDNIAPDITVSSISYEVYNKNNLEVYDSVTGVYSPQNIFDPVAGEKFIAEYNLSENCYVTVQVATYDNARGKGTTVATLLSNVPQNAGMNYVTWSGLTSSGKFVNNGTYVFVFTLKDLAGNTKSFNSDLKAVVKKSTNSTGQPFKGYDLVLPGAVDNYHAPASRKYIKALFNFFETPKQVSLYVYEKGVSNEVYTLNLNNSTLKLGTNTVNFDVYNNPTLKSVQYGVYYFRLMGSDILDNPFDIYSSFFVIDNRTLSVGTISCSPSLANRSTTGYNFAPISFTLTRPAFVTVQIVDNTNTSKVIKTLLNNNLMDGPVQIAWDLRNATTFASTNVPYKVKITAVDLGGNKVEDSSKTITINNQNPF